MLFVGIADCDTDSSQDRAFIDFYPSDLNSHGVLRRAYTVSTHNLLHSHRIVETDSK